MKHLFLVALLGMAVAPVYGQTAVGTWSEKGFHEVYVRHDLEKGHLLLETFRPRLNQLTIGVGNNPKTLEWQLRATDTGQYWAGFKKLGILLKPELK